MGGGIIGTNVVAQVGILVHDIEKTAQAYAELLGVDKPEIQLTAGLDEAHTRYLGEPTKARAKLAFFDAGPGVQIELIEPNDEPSTWRADLDRKGEGVHHIAFVIQGMPDKIAALEARGLRLLQTGEYAGGRYAYLDGNQELKLILELLENDR